MRAGGILALVLAAVLALAACDDEAADDGRLRVVTTVAPITSIVAAVVGDRAQIAGIVPEGTNSHTFEPRPSVAELLARADVLYMNGLRLEEPTRRLAERTLPDDAGLVELGDLAIPEDELIYDLSFPRSGGRPNPHLWTDPGLALRYSELVRDDLSERDPANAGAYAANQAAFAAVVDRLDRAMRAAFATVPAGDRVLLTFHDAYAYFARTYGWRVIGAIQVADFGEPTAREVARLIEQVRARAVPAIFGSEVFPSPVLARIGREAGVRYVDVLRDDDLPGAPGDPEHSWAGLMRFDSLTMVEALGGDATPLREVDLSGTAPDGAEYPQ